MAFSHIACQPCLLINEQTVPLKEEIYFPRHHADYLRTEDDAVTAGCRTPCWKSASAGNNIKGCDPLFIWTDVATVSFLARLPPVLNQEEHRQLITSSQTPSDCDPLGPLRGDTTSL
jgi:hypothetical protein